MSDAQQENHARACKHKGKLANELESRDAGGGLREWECVYCGLGDSKRLEGDSYKIISVGINSGTVNRQLFVLKYECEKKKRRKQY
jgi:hypothetical protein